MINLCAPAIIYLIFSITQILIDTYKGLYNTVFIKSIVTIMVTLLLNILCEQGLSAVSWIIVFIPFILMTVIVSMLLYVFGLDASTGKLNYGCDDKNKNNNKISNDVTVDSLGNIIIYDPEYNPNLKSVYYQSPNIIVPNPHANDTITTTTATSYSVIPSGSSSPSYQS
jgi:tetrahydromethanopterin S-methyltransferase subunit E